jgi:hypothetical protein
LKAILIHKKDTELKIVCNLVPVVKDFSPGSELHEHLKWEEIDPRWQPQQWQRAMDHQLAKRVVRLMIG